MRERDGGDEQNSQPHDAEASGTRGRQAIETRHSRFVLFLGVLRYPDGERFGEFGDELLRPVD